MNIKIIQNNIIVFIIGCIFFASCNINSSLNIFEKNISFSNQIWNTDNRAVFNFQVTDTTSFYNIFILLRHTDSYQFNNIWINVTAIASGDTAKTQQLNLRLGDNKKWFGSAMDDIIQQRILITQNPVKFKKGNYTFILQHIMREDDLNGILNAGIRIEKAGKI